MRRLLALGLPLMLAAAGMVLHTPTRAYADTVCQRTDPATGQCLIWVEVGPSPGGGGGGGGNNEPASGPRDTGSGNGCVYSPSSGTGGRAHPVACSSPYGYWSNQYNCYIKVADPPPAAGDPAWSGHDPDDGAVYDCYQPDTSLLIQLWLAAPPPDAAAGPTPREVAQMAVEQMNLSAIDIGITPRPGANSVGLVGMPVWMWAQGPDRHTFGPSTASASAGGITVSATAQVHEIVWDMGDGNEVVCTTAGTPYDASFGRKASPDCGHVYERSSAHERGERYTVTATSLWVITWEGAGQTGTIRLDGLSRSVDIAVGEAQVLVE